MASSSTTIPIARRKLLELSSLGIQPASITSSTLTLESDRFVCIREKTDGQNQVAIIDLHDANSVVRHPISADSAIMHPSQKIIALRAGRTLQVFNLHTKQKVKTHNSDGDIVFWKWISETTIAMVTDTTIYHWSIGVANETIPPQIMCRRHPTLDNTQIINYHATRDGKWGFLIGLSDNFTDRSVFKIKGSIQLFNAERGVSQHINGHAAALAEIKLDGNQNPTKLFLFAVRTATDAKLHIVEIDHQGPDIQFVKKVVDIYFPPEAAGDIPVAIQTSKKYGILYLLTKYGFIHLYDLETGTFVHMNRISSRNFFVAAKHEVSNGIIGVNLNGQVLSVNVEERTLIPYILMALGNVELAFKLANRADLPGAVDLHMYRYQQAFWTAPETSNSPRQELAPHYGDSRMLKYFGILLEKGQLDHLQSSELARALLQRGRKHLLVKWLNENKLTCTENLGDIIRPYDTALASNVYSRVNGYKEALGPSPQTGQPDMISCVVERNLGALPESENVLKDDETPDNKTSTEVLFEQTTERMKKMRVTVVHSEEDKWLKGVYDNQLNQLMEEYLSASTCDICFEVVEKQFVLRECGHMFCGICLRQQFSLDLQPRLLAIQFLAQYGPPDVDCQAIPTSRAHLRIIVDGINNDPSSDAKTPEEIFMYKCPSCRGFVTRAPIVPFKLSGFLSSVLKLIRHRLSHSIQYDSEERAEIVLPDYFEGLFLDYNFQVSTSQDY